MMLHNIKISTYDIQHYTQAFGKIDNISSEVVSGIEEVYKKFRDPSKV